jgi:hypothetical protein
VQGGVARPAGRPRPNPAARRLRRTDRGAGGGSAAGDAARPGEILSALLEAGADADRPDADGDTPLHYAAAARCPPATCGRCWTAGRRPTPAGTTAGRRCTPPPARASRPRWRCCSAAGADPAAADDAGDAPLHLAAAAGAGGAADVVRALLAAGADRLAANRAGDTPLTIAERAREQRVRLSLSVRRGRGEMPSLFAQVSDGADVAAVLRGRGSFRPSARSGTGNA